MTRILQDSAAKITDRIGSVLRERLEESGSATIPPEIKRLLFRLDEVTSGGNAQTSSQERSPRS